MRLSKSGLKKARKEAKDIATSLQRRVDKARDMLDKTTERLAEAIREDILGRSKSQKKAADRALRRVKEWHRVHRCINHASKHATDVEYLNQTFGQNDGILPQRRPGRALRRVPGEGRARRVRAVRARVLLRGLWADPAASRVPRLPAGYRASYRAVF